MRRKTMVHVIDLLGCVATGPTTEAALATTPAAIRAYLRFLSAAGEPVDPAAPFETRVVEHVTEGKWVGNGSPYLIFQPDLRPVAGPEIERILHRFDLLSERFANWAESQTNEALDLPPPGGGRPGRAVLLHVLGASGAYLSVPTGGAPGFSAVHGAVERGRLQLPDAFRQVSAMVGERVRGTNSEQRAAVIRREKDVRTLRKALRRLLEHSWEHLVELSVRPGGPHLPGGGSPAAAPAGPGWDG